jgi:1,4-alpha-glucan branching enzyme
MTCIQPPQAKEGEMAVKKQYFKTKSYCKVTFRLEKKKAGGAHRVALAGDFNSWQAGRTPMKSLKSGDFTASINLPKGREYQYRFVIDGDRWVTDDAADKHIYCNFAQAPNAVVVV